jgi:hypothetical protein
MRARALLGSPEGREMPHERSRLYALGGIALVASGFLFVLKSVLELMVGPPPSTGAEILAWTASHELVLALTNEALFFAFMSLVPAVVALYTSLADEHRNKAIIGCGIIAVSITLLGVMAIVQGRLVFPVFRMQVRTPEIAELVVSTYYAGLHAVAELFTVATIALSLAMRRSAFGSGVAYMGFATAASDFVGAYSWAIGPSLTFACGVLFGAWFVVVGIKLYRLPATA